MIFVRLGAWSWWAREAS